METIRELSPPVAPPKEKIATYAYFSTLYFVSVGVLFLWGYWSTFEINVLEFLSLADIIKLTAYPIVTTLVLTTVSGALGVAISHVQEVRREFRATGRTFKLLQTLYVHRKIVAALYFLVVALIAIFAPVGKWAVLPVLLAAPVVIYVAGRPLVKRFLPQFHVRLAVTLTVVSMIPNAYGTGRMAAERILSGSHFHYVVSEIEGVKNNATLTVSERLRYVGHAGDFVFFQDPKELSIIIAKFDPGKPLILKKFKKPDAVAVFLDKVFSE